MIEVQNISKTFKTRKKTTKALDNVSFTVNDGEVFGILGSNGAGKTTLLRIMASLIKPDCGDVIYGGTNIEVPNGAC